MCLCVLGKDRGGEKSAMNLTGRGGGRRGRVSYPHSGPLPLAIGVSGTLKIIIS